MAHFRNEARLAILGIAEWLLAHPGAALGWDGAWLGSATAAAGRRADRTQSGSLRSAAVEHVAASTSGPSASAPKVQALSTYPKSAREVAPK